MAQKHRGKIYLGFEDEFVTDKHRSLVNYATNKIGGKPDLYKSNGILPAPLCKLCGLNQLLALQLYAPLESSKYHRTLYIFACINPNCWNQNDSWMCIRSQSMECNQLKDDQHCLTTSGSIATATATNWLSTADDWDDGDNLDDNDVNNDNMMEQNGNNPLRNESWKKLNLYSKFTDVDDELNEDLSQLKVDDLNANSPASIESPGGGGATGRLDSPQASAEIEGEESEVVCIDTPVQPQLNLIELLRETTPHPFVHSDLKDPNNLIFNEMFINVDEEDLSLSDVSQHVRDLFLEYQLCNPDLQMETESPSNDTKNIDGNIEKYEKDFPKHGDEMAHHFLTRIKRNPGQLLRYSRDNSSPLLLHPLNRSIGNCKYCGGERIFEVQILPTLIPKLKLVPYQEHFEMEFGTVLIFTCSKSCWSTNDNYKEEFVVIQAEKL